MIKKDYHHEDTKGAKFYFFMVNNKLFPLIPKLRLSLLSKQAKVFLKKCKKQFTTNDAKK